MRQEVRRLRRNSGWTWFWAARRAGKLDWQEASTATEAIRRAILLPAGKPPPWLREAAATAEQQVLGDGRRDVEQATDSGAPG